MVVYVTVWCGLWCVYMLIVGRGRQVGDPLWPGMGRCSQLKHSNITLQTHHTPHTALSVLYIPDTNKQNSYIPSHALGMELTQSHIVQHLM